MVNIAQFMAEMQSKYGWDQHHYVDVDVDVDVNVDVDDDDDDC